MPDAPIYDTIGRGYRHHRRPDPLLQARITAALGAARTVVNVGAGSGSYEPNDRLVVPIEPSAVMAAQRPPGSPAIRGVAQDLPLHDQSVDAALTILSLHHWHPDARQGVAEQCRWDARHGHLRGLDHYDAGLRLIVGRRDG